MDEVGAPFPLLVSFAFAFGACIGSFLNVVIWRLPRGESLLWPGSRCPGCGAAIPAFANVPILSYLFLRGRCRACGVAISIRYPLVEALTGALFAALLVVHGISPQLLIYWLLTAALLAVTFVDLDHRIIPDEITLGGLAIGLAISIAWPSLTLPFPYALSGALLWGCSLWAFSSLTERIYKQPAFGMGDVKLLAMFASFFGVAGAFQMLVVGALIGLAYGFASTVPRIARIPLTAGPRLLAWCRFPVDAYLEIRKVAIPFGPGIAIAGIALMLQTNFAPSSASSAAEFQAAIAALARFVVS